MNHYMLMLFDDESFWQDATDEDFAAEMVLHRDFGAAVVAAGGRIIDSAALQSSNYATTVHREGGTSQITDGPFLESKEALGGYYVIEAPDVDVAIGLARQCPTSHCEVRPVFDTSAW